MKKYLAIAALIGLVIWGMYDVGGNKSKSPDTAANSASVQNTKSASTSAGASTNTDQGQPVTVGLENGNLAPDFELQSVNGETVKLSSLRGKKVIVNFWASWCPPCRLEMPEMENYYTKNRNTGVEILAVNLTTAEKSQAEVTSFMKADGITFPVLLDKNGDAARLYNISSIPASFILDSQGIIRDKIVGPMTNESMQEMLGNLK
ncbi:sporulation thiol-disulfide oxidoreductase A precursor [Desulfosporosinus acididurans]|uniref:Sporulation thiol-disulfide oxidoreductase A n=1 Tax=Desulfosporosinus acididurans TaxID=476652 RepID=A0A0J1FQZ0_9FIRM|nr:TlpA disulfide reductase family protein [Desulfosporosinus acididurans]KLU65915.1 sporulation thiol-disulfide oxidoreductase A precursor [Desulfosporosinus acididurans]